MPAIVGILTFISRQLQLINVKMPTIVGILTFMSRINTASESFKARKILIFQQFSFYKQLKFHFITSGPDGAPWSGFTLFGLYAYSIMI